MEFCPFITLRETLEKVGVVIEPMTQDDAKATALDPVWQSNWLENALQHTERYAMRTEEGELVALAAYEILRDMVYVHIVYMESHPTSNPTLTSHRKYIGIGRVLVAFGIKLSIDNDCKGNVVLEAKTPELGKHYVRDFGAVPVSQYEGVAPRFALFDDAAYQLFSPYLKEGSDEHDK